MAFVSSHLILGFRAIAILSMSNVPIEEVVRKFVAVDQLDPLKELVESALHTQGVDPSNLISSAGSCTGPSERLCTILLCIQLSQLMKDPENQVLQQDVEAAVSDPAYPLQAQILDFAAQVKSLALFHSVLCPRLNGTIPSII